MKTPGERNKSAGRYLLFHQYAFDAVVGNEPSDGAGDAMVGQKDSCR
jgi:hypothetical protein